jgi:hypothetical protein
MSHHLRRASLPAALLAVVSIVAFSPSGAGAQPPPADECDQSEPIVCIVLPSAGVAQPAAPAIAAPQIVPPVPPAPRPWPCVLDPLAAGPGTPVAPAIVAPQPPPALIPPGAPVCPERDVVARVNTYNAVYTRAARTLNVDELPRVAEGDALAMLRGYIATLRNRGTYLTLRMNDITLTGLSVDPGTCPPTWPTVCPAYDTAIIGPPTFGLTARVTTVERWTYEERSRSNGAVVARDQQSVQNLYELRLRDGAWFVFRNEIAPAGQPPPWGRIDPGYPPVYPPIPAPPYPPPPSLPPAPPSDGTVSARLSTDRSSYNVGDAITATVTNTGTAQISGGGGYRCGLIGLEISGVAGWTPAPGGAQICTLIALLLNPGESRTETFPAPAPGTYRLVLRASGSTFTSTPFTVK